MNPAPLRQLRSFADATPNKQRQPLIMAIKCYYDCSGDENAPSETFVTIACIAAPSKIWNEIIDPEWKRILEKRGAAYLHMKEAMLRRDEFDWRKGWTNSKVDALIVDLFMATRNLSKQNIITAVVSHKLDEENRKEGGLAEQCAKYCFRRIHASLADTGPNSTIDVYYDRSEKYLYDLEDKFKHIDQECLEADSFLRRIGMIAPVPMKDFPGIQFADMIAWTAHRRQISQGDHRATWLWNMFNEIRKVYDAKKDN